MVIFVPAVMSRETSSTMQLSPSEMPLPAFAPIRQRAPTAITSVPPPDSVPMMDAPPPTSESAPTTTPALMRPSTMHGPSVPALKLTNPSCMTQWCHLRKVSAQPHSVRVGDPHACWDDVVGHAGELVNGGDVQVMAQRCDRSIANIDLGRIYRTGARPGNSRQQAENTIKVQLVRFWDLSPAQQMQAKVRFRGFASASSSEPNSTDTTSRSVRPTRFARQLRAVSTPSGGEPGIEDSVPLSTSTTHVQWWWARWKSAITRAS